MDVISELINSIEKKNLNPTINLDRPIYVQPEDRILYRAHRVLVILYMLNTKNGLSKKVISCVDFLLRNSNYQKEFLLEYYKGKKTVINKFRAYHSTSSIEVDKNIVKYKSVPWDLRFNDMFLFLLIRELIKFNESKDRPRVLITEAGRNYGSQLESIFSNEINFLEIFGKKLEEDKTVEIITKIIPESYWKKNEDTIS